MNNLRVIFSINIKEIITDKDQFRNPNCVDTIFHLNLILNLGHCNVKNNYNVTF